MPGAATRRRSSRAAPAGYTTSCPGECCAACTAGWPPIVAEAAPDGGAVLDVGTGPGVLLVELAARRPDLRLTGVDLSADMIAAATRNLEPFRERASARVGDVTTLPFPDRSFDLIVSSLSLHHWDHPEAAVPELARILRPGGRVYIYDFPFAPFDKLADAARTRSVLNAHPPERTPIRTGVLFLPCVRYVVWPS